MRRHIGPIGCNQPVEMKTWGVTLRPYCNAHNRWLVEDEVSAEEDENPVEPIIKKAKAVAKISDGKEVPKVASPEGEE